MSAGDDPFGFGERTVVRPTPAGRPEPRPPHRNEAGSQARDAAQAAAEDDPFGFGSRTVIQPASLSVPQQPHHGAPGEGPDQPAGGAASEPTVLFGQPAVPPDMRGGAKPADATVLASGPPLSLSGQVADGPPGTFSAPLTIAELLRSHTQAGYPHADPIVAAAAPVLLLLGRLRARPAEPDATPALIGEATDAIRRFERRLAEAGVPPEEARIAKYVLCETVDDLGRQLPGTEGKSWARDGMLARFFKGQGAGTGFFEALNKVLTDHNPRPGLLELMHACLALGFEGQYRALPGGRGEAERIRRDAHAALRHWRGEGNKELSPRWRGESSPARRFRLPLWAVGAGTVASLAAVFVGLRVAITAEGDALAAKLLALSPNEPVEIRRAAFVPLKTEPSKPPAAVGQIERIRSALAAEIAANALSVEARGEFVVLEIGNALLFDPGSATLKPAFAPLADHLAAVLSGEKGAIRVVGHTDNVKPRRTSAFKSNFDLSVARAEAVRKALAPRIGDASRLSAEGKGEEEPIADNATPEGRARNRRIDLLLPREAAP